MMTKMEYMHTSWLITIFIFHLPDLLNSGGLCLQVGFFSGRKKESIFKSPDDHRGKVGVTGSGKGLTDFQRREKHLHLKGDSADAVDDEE